MSWRNWGNPPLHSTAGLTADPSTTTLVAEITGLVNGNYETRFVVGASTAGVWVLEHALSSGLGSTALRKVTHVFTGSNQSAEFVLTYNAEASDRFRVRMASTFTGNAHASIQAELLT